MNRKPLFRAQVNAKGQITIRSDVRQRLGIKPGGYVDVFELEKVDE